MFEFYDDIKRNKRRSMYIVSAFFFILTILVYTLLKVSGFGTIAALIAIPGSLITTYLTYLGSSKMILASVGAYKPTYELSQLENILDGLTIAASLEKKPEIYVINSDQINAFAAGLKREDAIICVTTGIIERLSRQELEAVIAHELAHIINYDIRLSMVMSAMAGVIVILGDLISRFMFSIDNDEDNGIFGTILIIAGILLAVLSPIITQLIQLMVSRRREYMADAGAVALTRNPEALIRALEKISTDTVPMGSKTNATESMFFENPNLVKRMENNKKKKSSLFSTHPTIEERIEAIRNLK